MPERLYTNIKKLLCKCLSGPVKDRPALKDIIYSLSYLLRNELQSMEERHDPPTAETRDITIPMHNDAKQTTNTAHNTEANNKPYWSWKKICACIVSLVIMAGLCALSWSYIVQPNPVEKEELIIPENGLDIGYYDPKSILMLEKILISFGYLKAGDLTKREKEVYGITMSKAVGEYQDDCVVRRLIKPEDIEDGSRGVYGPITRGVMRKDVHAGYKRKTMANALEAIQQ